MNQPPSKPATTTSGGQAQKVKVDILNREFAVACTPNEKPALLEAAKILDGRIRKLRSQGASTSQFDQLLVVVALNLCHELHHQMPADTDNNDAADVGKIKQLIDKIDHALSD
ncbi:MAG TPA: cell division protein ZapA [Marinagarivorans sp.]